MNSLQHRQDEMRRRNEAEKARSGFRGQTPSVQRGSRNGDNTVTAEPQAVDSEPARHGVPDRTSGASALQRESHRPANAPRLIDLRAGALYIGISRNSMRHLVEAGVVPVVTLPCARPLNGKNLRTIRRILIDVRDLDTLIEQSKERLGG
jgi:hypothetical protein